MSQHLNVVITGADSFGELLERPGCYEFDPLEGCNRRVLSKLGYPPLEVGGTVTGGTEPPVEGFALQDELELPEQDGLPDVLNEFGVRAFNYFAEKANGQGHRLLGGIATYQTTQGPQSGLFVSRRILLEMSFATKNAAIAPNKYPRYDVPPHPIHGRHAPPEVRALARLIPINDQERQTAISYALTRNSIIGALSSAVERRSKAAETTLHLVSVNEPDHIAA